MLQQRKTWQSKVKFYSEAKLVMIITKSRSTYFEKRASKTFQKMMPSY